jgi:hypothetical protein
MDHDVRALTCRVLHRFDALSVWRFRQFGLPSHELESIRLGNCISFQLIRFHLTELQLVERWLRHPHGRAKLHGAERKFAAQRNRRTCNRNLAADGIFRCDRHE